MTRHHPRSYISHRERLSALCACEIGLPVVVLDMVANYAAFDPLHVDVLNAMELSDALNFPQRKLAHFPHWELCCDTPEELQQRLDKCIAPC